MKRILIVFLLTFFLLSIMNDFSWAQQKKKKKEDKALKERVLKKLKNPPPKIPGKWVRCDEWGNPKKDGKYKKFVPTKKKK